MSDTHTVYRTRRSPFLATITDFDGTPYTASRIALITRLQLKYVPATGEIAEVADSLAVGHEDVFDITTYASSNAVRVDLGLLNFTAGRDQDVEVIVYDPDYPEGRVLNELLDILVSLDAEDGSIMTPTLLTTPLTIIDDDYSIVLADFNRSSVRLNSESAQSFTLPVGTSALDGKRIKFIIENIGDLSIITQGDDTITNSTYTTFTGTTRYGSITLEYNWALKIYTVSSPEGHWSGS